MASKVNSSYGKIAQRIVPKYRKCSSFCPIINWFYFVRFGCGRCDKMKVDVSFLIIFISSIFLLCVILWLIFHSEFVTHVEFLSSVLGIFGSVLAGFWSLWSKVSKISEDMGYLKSEFVHFRSDMCQLKECVNKLGKNVGGLKKDVNEMKDDVSKLKIEVGQLKGDVALLKGDVNQLKGM